MTVPSKHLPIETPEALGERRFTPRLLPRDPHHHDDLWPGRHAPRLRSRGGTRDLHDHRHPARPFRQLPAPADRPVDPEPWRSGLCRPVRDADPGAFRRAERCRGAGAAGGRDGSFPLRDVFDVPDLQSTHDDIVNGFGFTYEDGSGALAPFTAQRIDYSLARLSHYTATLPEHFQNHVLFTNYQFYIDEFEAFARAALADPDSGYTPLRRAGQRCDHRSRSAAEPALEAAADADLSPEAGGRGRDHAGQYRGRAVEREDGDRPYRGAAPACLADGGPLRGAAEHAEPWRFRPGPCLSARGHVLDDDLPVWVPIPALAEVQIALEEAVADVTEVRATT
jgi:hypothetical protein